MIPITISIDVGEYLKEKALKSVREKIRTQVRQAARAFIRAGFVRVPVDSGMSRGSFIPLATLLKVALPISPRRTNQKYFTGDLKSPELGASLATPQTDIFSEEGDVFTFYYDNDVLQYNLNELTAGGSKSAPWFSFQAGEDAFFDYLDKNLEEKLPQLVDFVKITSVISGPNGIVRRVQPLEEPEGEGNGTEE